MFADTAGGVHKPHRERTAFEQSVGPLGLKCATITLAVLLSVDAWPLLEAVSCSRNKGSLMVSFALPSKGFRLF